MSAAATEVSNAIVHHRQVRLIVLALDIRPEAELIFVQPVDRVEQAAAAIEPRSPGEVSEVTFVE
ncbi:MAG: hypothetical protein ACLP50_04280 [Solirubrobacteraceae bacterium]